MPTQNPVFIPGPTNLPDRLRHAMDMRTVNHRAPDFADKFVPLLNDIKPFFGTRHGEVIVFASTGTGGLEAALTNTLSPGDKILACRYGAFAQRWIDMGQRHGLDVQVVEVEWGEPLDVDAYTRILAADIGHRIKAVLATHNETSTGVTSNIAAIRQALDASAHPALLLVDCISSLASIEFHMDDWGVDVAIAGSQKGFMLAPGLSILALSPKALEACERSSCPRFYFDVRDMRKANAAGSFPYTPPTGLINGLRESVAMLTEEGLPQVFARHQRMAEGTRRAVAAWGLELCARHAETRSDTVTAVKVPDGFDSTALTEHAYARYKVSFGGGLGDLAGKVFRIGHVGDMTEAMLLAGLATAEMAMHDLGYPIEMGAGVSASQHYFCQPQAQARRGVA